MTRKKFCAVALALLVSAGGWARPLHAQETGPKNGTLLIIRHAEKPEDGDGLTPAGEARARAYVAYFQSARLPDVSLPPAAIFAAADSRHSRRPRLTVEPLAQALKLSVQTTYQDQEFAALAAALRGGACDGKTVLVCWHHGVLPELLRSLGADPAAVLPGGEWPPDQYDWLLVLRYDADGHLKDARRVVEGLHAK